MPRGITFATREEAKEYADSMRRQGWIATIGFQPETKVYIVTIGATATKPVPEEIPTTAFEALRIEAEAREATAEVIVKAEAEAERWERREKIVKGISRKAVRGVGELGGIAKEDILGGFEKQKHKGGYRAGDVLEGMKRAIPPRPYTAEHTPRIGIEGAVGVRSPRIGRISRVGEHAVYFPQLRNGGIPSRAQLVPTPKPNYLYFKSKKGREEEKK